MTEKKMNRLLERFANEHTLAKDIKVTVTSCCKSFEAKGDNAASYDDVVLLSDLVRGAESFLLWIRRKKVRL